MKYIDDKIQGEIYRRVHIIQYIKYNVLNMKAFRLKELQIKRYIGTKWVVNLREFERIVSCLKW